MKAHWLILPLIFLLIPLFILSREKVTQRVEMSDEDSAERKAETITLVPDEEVHSLYESVSKFRMHMKSLDEYDDELALAIDRQNWNDISKYALLLKNTSPLIFTGKRKIELPKEFVLLDTSFHFQSLAVVEASESREMVKLNIEYEKLRKTCDDCHEKYKNKE